MAKSSVATGRSKALVRRETRSAYLFLLPNLIFFVGFVVIPMILCVYTSFFDSTMGKDVEDVFIGLKNYTELYHHLSSGLEKYFRDRTCFGARGLYLFFVGVGIDLQDERRSSFYLPLCFLSAGRYRFGGGYCSMEMDVQ